MKKIAVVTGTRAEYGLLELLIREIHESHELDLQLIVTGMHLSPEFGLTVNQICYPIAKKVELLLSSDSPVGISKSVGLGCISFAEAFEELQPDLLIVLGDRFEVFAAATAAMISRLAITHIHGGERTEGAIDEAIRHSISKMSQLHFVATEEYRQRVIQLGEHPDRVFCVGGMGVDVIARMRKNGQLLSKKELAQSLGISWTSKLILVTLHPVTLEQGSQ